MPPQLQSHILHMGIYYYLTQFSDYRIDRTRKLARTLRERNEQKHEKRKKKRDTN